MRREHALKSMMAGVGAVMAFAAAPAMGLEANYDPVFGFEPDGLAGLPELEISRTDPFFGVTPGVDPVVLLGTSDYCILVGTSPTCRSNAICSRARESGRRAGSRSSR